MEDVDVGDKPVASASRDASASTDTSAPADASAATDGCCPECAAAGSYLVGTAAETFIATHLITWDKRPGASGELDYECPVDHQPWVLDFPDRHHGPHRPNRGRLRRMVDLPPNAPPIGSQFW